MNTVKTILVPLLICGLTVLNIFRVQAQCNPSWYPGGHSIVGPSSSVFQSAYFHIGETTHNAEYTEEDICMPLSSSTWVLAFEDEFDGNSLDRAKWSTFFAGPDTSNEEPANLTGYLDISNGTLKLTTGFNLNNNKYIATNLITKQWFPAGKIEVIAKMPARVMHENTDVAPLWLYSDYLFHDVNVPDTGEYRKEIDIEFMENTLSQGVYTLHSFAPSHRYSDAESLGCSNASLTYTDGNWHKFTIVWDMYQVIWYVDSEIVDHLSRMYLESVSWGATTWDHCTPIPVGQDGYIDHEFPMFANMQFVLGSLGSQNSIRNPDSYIADAPYTVEYESIKYWRKIDCNKLLLLPPSNQSPLDYRSAGAIDTDASGGSQMPPTVENQTPSVLTGGRIIVGHEDGSVPYVVRRDDYFRWNTQYLNLYASEDITLNPGFETDLLYMVDGPYALGTTPYGVVNAGWIDDVFTADVFSCPMSKTDDPPLPDPQQQKEKVQMLQNFAFQLYPNPASEHCQVAFNIPDDAEADISMYDMTGRVVKQISHQFYYGGQSRVDFSIADLSTGLYTVKYTDSKGNAIAIQLAVEHDNK